MPYRTLSTPLTALPALLLCLSIAGQDGAAHANEAVAQVAQESPSAARKVKPHLDRSGRRRVGKASFYAKRFTGKMMADGTRMRPHEDSAASKTLPLGTTARVTNLETGNTAVVTIRDRGPYVKGRIVDLSPSTAKELGLDPKQGVARVAVTPMEIPPQDSGEKR